MAINDNEEYQFSEDENASPPSVSAATAAVDNTAVRARQKKGILIIIGIIIGAFCLYKLYGLFTAALAKPKIAVPAALETVQKPPEKTSVIPNEKQLEAEPLKQQVSTLEQAMTKSSQAQENLQNQIAELSAAITGIQNNVAAMTQQINTLANPPKPVEKAAVPKAEKSPGKKIKKAKPVHKKAPVSVANHYAIKALIQGRAWLVNTHGETFTVSIGDLLPGYGQIQKIDPDKGIVMTSAGKVLSFMPHDR